MDDLYPNISDSLHLDIQDHCLLDHGEMDLDIVNDLLNPKSKLTDIGYFDLESFLNPPTTNNDNNNNINNNKMIVKHEPVAFSSLTYIQAKPELCFNSPNSPESPFSTHDFPEELSGLEPYESEIDNEQFQFKNISVPVVNVESPNNEVKNYDIIASNSERDTDHDRNHLIRRPPRAYSPDSTDSESDPDYDPEEEEEHPPRRKTEKKEITSYYKSEEMESEKPLMKTSRRPSKNPVPQQRKKGSKQKISSWIVSLLRNPETNPCVITWEDEPRGKFRVTDSVKYAELWGEVKRNPNMNYEKLSRAMRYYYKNKEISMVAGERLTYAFGPSMRDFHARNKEDPNFEYIHKREQWIYGFFQQHVKIHPEPKKDQSKDMYESNCDFIC